MSTFLGLNILTDIKLFCMVSYVVHMHLMCSNFYKQLRSDKAILSWNSVIFFYLGCSHALKNTRN